jgi:Secretion system C-terminal sorting domain
VERSFDGASFTRIGRTEINRSAANGQYQYNDANLFDNFKGTVYYRIKLVNRTGEAQFTAIRAIKSDADGFALNLYPNPVVKEANLAFTLNEAKQVAIILTDAAGKQITNINMQAQKGLNQKTMDVSSLAAGTYIFRIIAGDESQTLSFVKSN